MRIICDDWFFEMSNPNQITKECAKIANTKIKIENEIKRSDRSRWHTAHIRKTKAESSIRRSVSHALTVP